MGMIEYFVQTLTTPISPQTDYGMSSIPFLNLPITYITLFAVGSLLWINNMRHSKTKKSDTSEQ